MLCHGSPYDEDEYVFNVHHAAQILALYPVEVHPLRPHAPAGGLLDRSGHERPRLRRARGRERPARQEPRYLINPGSVGQPRDRNPHASCIIFDTDKPSVQFFRVEYDVAKTQSSILKAGLPEILATRLQYGT